MALQQTLDGIRTRSAWIEVFPSLYHHDNWPNMPKAFNRWPAVMARQEREVDASFILLIVSAASCICCKTRDPNFKQKQLVISYSLVSCHQSLNFMMLLGIGEWNIDVGIFFDNVHRSWVSTILSRLSQRSLSALTISSYLWIKLRQNVAYSASRSMRLL